MPMTQKRPTRVVAVGGFGGSEPKEGVLSSEFVSRLLRFVSWKPGWDGAEAAPIDSAIAEKAYKLAVQSVGVLQEPFIAPADGALLLRWHLPGNAVVEVFVEDDEIECLGLIKEHEVREIPASGIEGVLSFLRSQTSGLAGLRRA